MLVWAVLIMLPEPYPSHDSVPGGHFPVAVVVIYSVLVGAVISYIVGSIIIRPMEKFNKAFERLAKGDFSVRILQESRLGEIREMAEHFNRMAYELSQIETLRSDFVASISHEFKTPIAAIEGYAALLQDESLSRDEHDLYISKILANTRQLSNLSSNILTLSKLENQDTALNEKEYRLDEQLRQAVLMLESKWNAKEIEFDIELPNVMYYGSERLLYQVWYNIIDNAIKHSNNGGVIKIAINRTENTVSVSIADNGDGMSDEVLKHIFEKFYQGDRSRKSEGNGLGLALVKRIVELSNGTVSVESEAGKGSCFTVTLPVTAKKQRSVLPDK